MNKIPITIVLLCAALAVQPARSDDESGVRLAPEALRAAVERVLPSIVTIETFGGGVRGGQSKRGQIIGISQPGDGPTTGVVVSPDGYIITSTYNFLKKPEVITVVLRDGSQHVAELLGRDETRKLCLLKIDGVSDLPVPALAPRGEVKVGQWAASVGVGYGDDDPAISLGIISANHRIGDRAVQTDANISPANYGGPLVDLEGRLLGVCSPLSPESQSAAAGSEWYDSGIGFAVPLDGAEQLMARLKRGDVLQAGKMGIQAKPASAEGGVAVAEVLPDGPAAKAGLQAGDKIISVGGHEIVDALQLRNVIGRYLAGDELAVVVQRGEEQLTLQVTLQAGLDQPAGAKPMRVAPRPAPDKKSEPQPAPKPQPTPDSDREPKSPPNAK